MDEVRRLSKLRLITRFIEEASIDELLWIVDEIVHCHDNMYIHSSKHASLDRVASVCLNGENIQLNVEEL